MLYFTLSESMLGTTISVETKNDYECDYDYDYDYHQNELKGMFLKCIVSDSCRVTVYRNPQTKQIYHKRMTLRHAKISGKKSTCIMWFRRQTCDIALLLAINFPPKNTIYRLCQLQRMRNAIFAKGMVC